MCYATFSYSKSRQFGLGLALGLVSLAVFITLYYHYLQDPAFHQNTYALLTAVVLFRSMYVMEFSLRPSLRLGEEAHRSQQRKASSTAQEKETRRSEDRRDEKILKNMWLMITCGLSIFLGGFVIWSLDNEYCSDLRRWRRQIGLPWGILLEGHGWWYVFQPSSRSSLENESRDILANEYRQASHDWYWRILLHHLGYMAPSFPERSSERIQLEMASSPLLTRNCTDRDCKWTYQESTVISGNDLGGALIDRTVPIDCIAACDACLTRFSFRLGLYSPIVIGIIKQYIRPLTYIDSTDLYHSRTGT